MDATLIYVAGTTKADALFPLYAGNPIINKGGVDAFVCAIELNGTTRWVSTLSGDLGGDEVVKDLSSDESGQLYVAGSYTLNLNTTDIPIESKGGEDVFLASFTMDGGENWIKTAGGAGADMGNAVCAATPGVVYLAGAYQDDAAFDGEIMPANGLQNAFLAKLNLNCIGVSGGQLTASDTVVEEGEVFTLVLSDHIGEIKWEYLPVGSSDWQLLTADMGNPIQVTPTGTADYRAFVTSADCPADSSNIVRVEVINPNIRFAEAGEDVTICWGDSVQLKASGGDYYKWVPPGALDRPDTPDPWAKPLFTTKYIVHVTRTDGLTDTDEVIVNVLPRPSVNAGDDISACKGEEVKLSAQGDGELFWFRLDLAVDPTVSDPIVTLDTTATFAVMVVDADGCRGFDDVTVYIKEPPVANAGRDRVFISRFEARMEATLEPDETGIWNLESGSGVWDNPREPDTRVSGLELGDNIFSWTVTNQICPESVDYVTYRVSDFILPNVITPNGDGKNDYFHINGIESHRNSELVILNRWGDEVFRASPYINNWDGVTQNGNELPEDTYYYVLKIKEEDVRKGFIMILR
jgi:gliding motility-associated-like protein